MRRIPFILIPILFISCAGAQNAPSTNTRAVKQFEEGLFQYRSNNLKKALLYFDRALKYDPGFTEAHIQKGAVYYDMKRWDLAEFSFEKALEYNAEATNKINFSLGKTEMKQKKFEEAAIHFQEYLQRGATNDRLKANAEKFLSVCEFSAIAYANPVPYNPVNLGKGINTSFPEYLPALTADSENLIFTRRVNGQEDLYISSFEDGEWGQGRPISDVNTLENEGGQTISADGRVIVFTACNRSDGQGSCDLYISEIRNGKWVTPRNIGAPINSKHWESQPSLSADGNILYFASKRPGGQGGADLWVSDRTSGKWSEPRNLGTTINTSMDEKAPCMHPDGQTLYFMSNSHPGMGGFDLFYTRNVSGQWENPTNIGYPINTSSDEGAFFISLDGRHGFFASDKPGQDANGSTDIYAFELYDAARPLPVTYVKAVVKDKNTLEPLSAYIEFADVAENQVFASSLTDEQGTFLVCLPVGANYALNVSGEGYLFHSEHFQLDKAEKDLKPFLLEIFLQPIPFDSSKSQVEPVILKNVFFDTGSAALLPASQIELKKLYTFLMEYPDLNIQINGHTDNIGSDEDNLILSKARAKAVYDYLIQKEIEPGRISYRGYGETVPIDSNDTDQGRQRNRRTEFEILP